jgi:RimJ/RimL family protein N-acetyltransferase
MRAEIITTGRLDMLPLRVEHAEEMAGVLDDPALHTFIGGSPDTPQVLRARYARMVEGPADRAVSWLNWVLRLREQDRLTGYVQATIDPSEHGPVAEVAWVVGTPWQGKGIATEAALALVDWLDRQGIRTIIAHIHPDHRASAAVATAIGLTATDEWHDGEVRWRRDTDPR